MGDPINQWVNSYMIWIQGNNPLITRRSLIQTLPALPLATGVLHPVQGISKPKTLRVAGIGTQYFKNSHCDVIFSKLLEGWTI